ncbi:hypothetical protein IAQ61_007710 [Plenodomus lingam]|uniref:uncharacterized protein n=1 Tax=Leptosphaeria maculans TaxID=5022 RepID=UPI0033252825|nr:hypothetical protein IAQ61_007710 [Plenodomus lingam]
MHVKLTGPCGPLVAFAIVPRPWRDEARSMFGRRSGKDPRVCNATGVTLVRGASAPRTGNGFV